MNSRTLTKRKNKNSTAFPPVFGKKLKSRTFTSKSADEVRDVSNPKFGHNFGDVQVERPSFKQSCPLALPGPSHCPFGGTCHTCPPRVQAKLKIGQPGDKYEQEADKVAEHVMKMPESKVQRKKCLSCSDMDEKEQIQTKLHAGRNTPLVQRQVEEEEDEEEILQTKEIPGQTPEVTQDVQTNIHNLRGAGKPLPETERSFFEPRFGYDFKRVRVHTDTEADTLSCILNSHAFTTGRDIFFRKGVYSVGSLDGRRIMAHELTHVVQQNQPFRGQESEIQLLSVTFTNKLIQRQDCSRYKTRNTCTPFNISTRPCRDSRGRVSKCRWGGIKIGCICPEVSEEPKPTGRIPFTELLMILLMLLLGRGMILRPQPGIPGLLPPVPGGPIGPGRVPEIALKRNKTSETVFENAIAAATSISETERVVTPRGAVMSVPQGVKGSLQLDPEAYMAFLRLLDTRPSLAQLHMAVAQAINQADKSLLLRIESVAKRLPRSLLHQALEARREEKA